MCSYKHDVECVTQLAVNVHPGEDDPIHTILDSNGIIAVNSTFVNRIGRNAMRELGTVIFQVDRFPVAGEYDVVVIGAGPGGIGAAVAASRAGASTLLVDRFGYPGGMGTAGNVCHMMCFGIDGRQVIGGIADELVRKMNAAGWAYQENKEFHPDFESLEGKELGHHCIIDSEGLKIIANRLLDDSGVVSLFYTTFIGVIRDDSRITGVVLDTIEGPVSVTGRVFVDATGDAHLCYRAGLRVREAPVRESMTKTILMDFGNVTEFDKPRCKRIYAELFEKGMTPFPNQDAFMGVKLIDPCVVHVNHTLAVGSSLHSSDATRMDKEMREQVMTTLDFYRTNIPGFQDAYLVRTAHTLGIRAGRGGIGIESITGEMVDASPEVSEPIAVNKRSYGGHGVDRFRPIWQASYNGTQQVPWKALIQADIDNLVLAGRCISADWKVLDTFRLIPACMAVGEAAGITAALSARKEGVVKRLSYAAVRTVLIQNNAILDIPETVEVVR